MKRAPRPMTIGELVETLSQFKQDLPIYTWNNDGDLDKPQIVAVVKKNAKGPDTYYMTINAESDE